MQQNWLNWKHASQWLTHSRQTLGNAWKRSCPLTTSANVWRRSLIPRQTSRLIIIILSLSLILRNSTFRNPPQSQRNSTFRNATQKQTTTKLWNWRRLANKQWVPARQPRWIYWGWILIWFSLNSNLNFIANKQTRKQTDDESWKWWWKTDQNIANSLWNNLSKTISTQAKAAEGIDSCKERTKCGGAKDPVS